MCVFSCIVCLQRGRFACVCMEESECVTIWETLKKKKPCWFSMQMTALVVTKALMLGLEKWSDSVTTPGHFRHVFVYSCFIPFSVAISQMFPISLFLHCRASFFGVSSKMCERMLTKQRGVADVYTLVLALRLTVLAEGYSTYEGTSEASVLTTELVISKCAHCNLDFNISRWSEHIPDTICPVSILFGCYYFWGGR